MGVKLYSRSYFVEFAMAGEDFGLTRDIDAGAQIILEALKLASCNIIREI